MGNFIDTAADFEHRLGELSARLFRIESHLRRKEFRAATALVEGMLDEFEKLEQDMQLPLETIVVGAQLGFFSGGSLLRGRIPGTLIGATAGWLYGQQSLQKHRRFMSELFTRVEEIYAQLQAAPVEKSTESA